ncbi:Wall-associated receptor kinase 5 [Vitis vinifera]|uniref:Wall-associated receptor kinase 5 n=1 Tax=Vitis vinifera TaxID=29760 RepID=A0A438G8P9_VITVI|nr:Wall-associated receptor kinase 5 [Vitis vinifera]
MRMLLQVLVSVHLITIIISFVFIAQEAGASMTKPGCPEKCGNITIPYPFGMGKGCYLNRNFEITCNMSSNPPRPLLLQEVQLLQISEDYLRINDIVHHSCFNKQSGKTNSSHVPYNRTHHFSYSHTQNEFIAIGCDIFAYITEDNSKTNATGCASLCNTDEDIATDFSSSACSGIGCCRTYLQTDISRFYLKMRSINMITPIWTSQPCGLAFISERNFSIRQYFNLSSKFLERNLYFVPAVLDWSVGDVSCPEAIRKKTMRVARIRTAITPSRARGISVTALKATKGTPTLQTAAKIALCTNVPGSYSCTCPTDYHGDGKKDGTGCIRGKHPHLLSLVLSLGVGITVVPFILIATSLSKESVEKTKLYSVEELEKATDGFNLSRIIGKGGLGTVYKGMLSDGSIVAIKKSNTVDEKQLDQFINEVLILSQINHRHIVKLLEYLGKIGCELQREIAGALAYLHSHASTAICHRDIKSSNYCWMKTSGLYFLTLDSQGQLTDKSDVYAFGVVLAELLTGEKAISFDRFEQGLASHFRSAMKQNHLFDILDNQVVNEGQKDDIFAVAKLTKRCLKLNGKKRPTMKQVEIDLQQLGRFQEQFSCQNSMIQEDFSQQQTCQDDCTVSERSHSYTFGPATEEIVQDIEVLFS